MSRLRSGPRRARLPAPLRSDDDHDVWRPTGRARAGVCRLDCPAAMRRRSGSCRGTPVVEALVVLAGGVLADRLPRSVILAGASLLQGRPKPDGLVHPVRRRLDLADRRASGGLRHRWRARHARRDRVDPTDREPRGLQQANALLGPGTQRANVIGPSVAGVIIVAGTPGIALAVDAASFFVCAGLLALIRLSTVRETATTFIDDLREGWSEFWTEPGCGRR